MSMESSGSEPSTSRHDHHVHHSPHLHATAHRHPRAAAASSPQPPLSMSPLHTSGPPSSSPLPSPLYGPAREHELSVQLLTADMDVDEAEAAGESLALLAFHEEGGGKAKSSSLSRADSRQHVGGCCGLCCAMSPALILCFLLGLAALHLLHTALPPPLPLQTSSGLCPAPYPPAQRLRESDALVEQWLMCPMDHDLPHRRPHEEPLSADANASLRLINTSYPRTFLLQPNAVGQVYAILAHEATYNNVKQGHWTLLVTVWEVERQGGDWVFSGEVLGLPKLALGFFHEVARHLTCTDSITHTTSPAVVERSYYWAHLHCPFTRRPHLPQHRQPRPSHPAAPSSYPMQATVSFHHPLFSAALPASYGSWDMAPVNAQLRQLQGLGSGEGFDTDTNWVLLQSQGRLPASSSLSVPMCMRCVPRVDISHCSAPLMNERYLRDIHSHIVYHTALGVQRHTIYDRWNLYGDVLQPYVDSGLVEHIVTPLPFRNVMHTDAVPADNFFGEWRQYFDQEIVLEGCRIRMVTTSAWLLYNDLDELVSFPVNTSFVRQDRAAACYSAEWRRSPPALMQQMGEATYVHVSIGQQHAAPPPPPAHASSAGRVNDSQQSLALLHDRTSLYSHYQPHSALAFMQLQRAAQEGGLFPAEDCPSPMLAYLTAVTDVRLMQRETRVPWRGDPTAHLSPDGRLPLALPCDGIPDGTVVSLHQHLEQTYRWQWIAMCDVDVVGPERFNASEAATNGNLGINGSTATPPPYRLMLQRWEEQRRFDARREQRQKLKFFARPEAAALFNHLFVDQAAIDRGGPNVDWPALRRYQPDMRPCDEVHFKHFRNFPNTRVPVNPDEEYQRDPLVRTFYDHLLDSARHAA